MLFMSFFIICTEFYHKKGSLHTTGRQTGIPTQYHTPQIKKSYRQSLNRDYCSSSTTLFAHLFGKFIRYYYFTTRALLARRLMGARQQERINIDPKIQAAHFNMRVTIYQNVKCIDFAFKKLSLYTMFL